MSEDKKQPASTSTSTAASTTPASVRAQHEKIREHARTHVDSHANSNDDPDGVAFDALRSEIHAGLQLAEPPPPPHPDDEGDPELHHARQKIHFKRLWKRTDEIIAAAGITAPRGRK